MEIAANQPMLPIVVNPNELAANALNGPDSDVAALARSLLLSMRSGTPVQDQLDCAEIALKLGFKASARLLYGAAFVRGGRSPQALAYQRKIALRSALWPERPVQDFTPPSGSLQFQVDLAILELRKIVELASKQSPIISWDVASDLSASEQRVGLPADPPQLPDAEVIAHLVDELHFAIADADVERLSTALACTSDQLFDRPLPSPADEAHASVFDLATLSAAAGLHELFVRCKELGWAPFGSPALLLASAGGIGIGPYLAALPAIVDQPLDLVGMIRMAGAHGPTLEHLLILFAGVLRDDQLEDLAALAYGSCLTMALYGLSATAKRLKISRPSIYGYARDAALAAGDIRMAIEAQKLLRDCDLDHIDERVRLKHMLAAGEKLEAVRSAAAAPQSMKASRVWAHA